MLLHAAYALLGTPAKPSVVQMSHLPDAAANRELGAPA